MSSIGERALKPRVRPVIDSLFHFFSLVGGAVAVRSSKLPLQHVCDPKHRPEQRIETTIGDYFSHFFFFFGHVGLVD